MQEQGSKPEYHYGFMPLGMIANTIDGFSGKENVRDYFEKIEKRAKLDNWKEEDTLNLIKYRLTGEASNFLKSCKQLDTLKYAEFKVKFISQFSQKNIPGQALINLGRCYQRYDESVVTFATRVKLFGRQILEEDLENAAEGEAAGLEKKCNQLVLNQFKIGLKREILEKVGTFFMREINLNIEKAVEIANFEELNQLTLKSRNKIAMVQHDSNQFCSICRKNNHNTENCYFKGKKPICNFCNKPNHLEINCWFKNRNNRGLSVRETQVHSYIKICNFCHKKGHLEEQCWKKNNKVDRVMQNERVRENNVNMLENQNEILETSQNDFLNANAPLVAPRRERRY